MNRTVAVESPPRIDSSTSPWSALTQLGLPLLQLGLVLILIYQYQLESRTFFKIFALGIAGFGIHALLPLAYRLPFFALLSLAGIGVAFGWSDGLWLVALGSLLIGICHLPIRFAARVATLLVVGGGLAALRGGFLSSPWTGAIWPILGSMFMFRLALYLYALKNEKTRVNPFRSLAYFFMLPNVCFPLFPVVDYQTFSRSYFDRPVAEIYGKGVQWIMRGVVHLLLYRFVYLFLANDPAELQTLGDVLQFLLSTFLLYLRVSGQFHLIVGMLYLFGFRLPETHRLYYLASTFTDFWRRINIYWKDFMMKLVYYPSFFRLRRWGDRAALVWATVIVFLATWILHSYQWFWLRGGFPIAAQDGFFWGILGCLVVVNALREREHGRRRSLVQEQGWRADRAIRTVLMFWSMTILWSLWSTESVTEWALMWGPALQVDARGILLLISVSGVLLALGGRSWSNPAVGRSAVGVRRFPFVQPLAQPVVPLVALAIAAHPVIADRTGETRFATAFASFQSTTLNARDAALLQRGYYENLDNESRMSTELWRRRGVGDDRIWLALTDAYRQREDFLWDDMHPGSAVIVKGSLLTTNQWGIRDSDYPLSKSAGTYRIAVIGPSHVMGSGVADDETFENLLEERLNRDGWDDAYTNYEVLNFGFSGFSILQQVAILEERVFAFDPDVVVMTVPSREHITNQIVKHLSGALGARVEVPYPQVRQILSGAGLDDYARAGVPIPYERARSVAHRLGFPARMPAGEARQRIQGVADPLIDWAIRSFATLARDHEAVPVFLALDLVTDSPLRVVGLDLAEQVGFLTLDLRDVYGTRGLDALRVAPSDDHPNAAGHRLIADRLYAEFVTNGAALQVSGE